MSGAPSSGLTARIKAGGVLGGQEAREEEGDRPREALAEEGRGTVLPS